MGRGERRWARSASACQHRLGPAGTFVYNILRLGFLDGLEGLLLHLYHAVYVSWKYAKAWEHRASNSDDLTDGRSFYAFRACPQARASLLSNRIVGFYGEEAV